MENRQKIKLKSQFASYFQNIITFLEELNMRTTPVSQMKEQKICIYLLFRKMTRKKRCFRNELDQ
jgi:hypothetical protein